jgi:hypothetical protein
LTSIGAHTSIRYQYSADSINLPDTVQGFYAESDPALLAIETPADSSSLRDASSEPRLERIDEDA